jgi:integrase
MEWARILHHRDRGSGVASTQRIPCRRKSHLEGPVRRFLADLESSRGCKIATRNQRLAAVRALAAFVAEHSPVHIEWCGQIRSIPFKRAAKAVVPYLEKAEMDALLAAPDRRTTQGRRCVTPALRCHSSSRSSRRSTRCTLRHDSLWNGCNRRRRCSPPSARRLCFVRGFARYRSATDPFTEVPSPELLPYRSSRARPYLYTEQEVQGLLEAALQLPTTWPSTPLRPWVFHCLLGLLSVTGLRISEALDLKLHDVDLEQGVLTIRATKCGRSRLVPLHPSSFGGATAEPRRVDRRPNQRSGCGRPAFASTARSHSSNHGIPSQNLVRPKQLQS